MSSSADWTCLSKESVSFKICQQELLKLKAKGKKRTEKKRTEKKTRMFKNCGTITKDKTYTQQEYQKEKREKTDKRRNT